MTKLSINEITLRSVVLDLRFILGIMLTVLENYMLKSFHGIKVYSLNGNKFHLRT